MPERSRVPVTTTSVHGVSAYTNHGCGCDVCRSAFAGKQRAARARRRLALEADPTLAPHGRDSTYTNWLCRCEPCTKAHTKARHTRGLWQ